MISENRILTIFRKKGGPGAATSVAIQMLRPEHQFLKDVLSGERPLIVRVQSQSDWFVLTKSELITSNESNIQRTSLSDIKSVVLGSGISQLVDGKIFGALIELELVDGTRIPVPQDAGKPFTGMLNVFMYIARVNQHGPRGHELAMTDIKKDSMRIQ
jgi:hypothetical protein